MEKLSNIKALAQAPTALIDFGRNFPPPIPLVADAIRASFSYLSKTKIEEAIRFPRFVGTSADREAAANWVTGRLGQKPDANRLVLANGSQSILAMLMAHFIKPGGVMLTEALTYPAIKPLTALFDIRLQSVEIDGEGIIPESLEESCIRLHDNVRALYCMPTLHNPTSAIMSERRRQEVAKIARRHNLWIFEDDIYGVLPQKAPPALSAFAPERSWHIVGLSKSLASQLRVAYVTGPTSSLVESVYWPGVRTTNWMAAPIVAEIATHWLESGLASDILASVRAETVSRRGLAQAILCVEPHTDPSSYHLWIELPDRLDVSSSVQTLKQHGVIVGAGESFAVNSPKGDHRIRIGLGVPADHHELRRGLMVIRKVLGDLTG
ncbi:aminotransferase class I/II-fold pyridoxal phosphate-dependent enzyme [Sinorhizobium meliloti]|nr:aminotransferase class I/II-fold pyridoxal phosphate-dependent enzyme [Sinorhizobium meliloti]